MKLSPPASSSDIEVAREIARRLHQRRRRDDRPPLDPARLDPVPPERPAHTEAAHAVAPPPWNPPAFSAPAPTPTPDLSAPLPAPPDFGPPVEEPAPPSWDAAPADGEVQEPEDALDALTSEPEGEPEPAAGLDAAPPDSADLDVPHLDPGGDTPSSEAFEEADAYGGSPQVSPFGETDTLEPPDIEPADLPPPDEEELFDSPAGPSWGDVAETCMDIAHARGALLADGTGGLIAARGEWPEPGPEAIASRLVAMMDRTLKDAPTRSVSAPVGGMHLTAWRAPAGERVLTAAFIADAPVPATVRPEIDSAIGQGAGP